ncbi:MAG: alpha/beta hydrolase [Acidobacteriota bacterium]
MMHRNLRQPSRWPRLFVLLSGFAVLMAAAGPSLAETSDSEANFSLAGTWDGALTVPGGRLRLAFHFVEADGGWSATLDSLDQGAMGIPAGGVSFEDGRLKVSVPAISGQYDGAFESADAIDGAWFQGGARLELDLERRVEDSAPASDGGPERPQDPEPPYPYLVQGVDFPSHADDVTLAGTLTVPEGAGPFPAVALISGSGPQDRDSFVLGHRPFLVLADYLTRRGVAVLRYDDRGIGESTGDFAAATTRDFALDAAGAAAFLAGRDRIAAVGLVGHSEGGIVAPLVAADGGAVDFVVLLAPPAVTGRETLVDQGAAIFTAAGRPPEWVAEHRKIHDALFEAIVTDQTDAEIDKAIGALIDYQGGVGDAAARQQQVEAQRRGLTGPWFREMLTYDPAPTLSKVGQPVLALFGAKDTQVTPALHRPALEKALAQNDRADVETLAGLNHLFQTAGSGLVVEYSQIDETFAPAALDRIATWILEQRPQASEAANE